MVSRKALTRSYRRGCKSLDGFAYYDLGLLHEHRAEAAASRLFEDGMSDLLEREWVEAVHNADACFRTALRQGIAGAASSICRLRQVELGQRLPVFVGDKVRIHDLVSSLGRRLNQRDGVVLCYVGSSGRFGVAIDGFGIKYIRFANLTRIDGDADLKALCVRQGCACDSCVV